MSTFYTKQVTCPACRVPFEAWIARGVHAARRTDLREDILARRFHRRTCSSCNAALHIEQQLVYTDFDLHQWVYVATERDRPDWRAWEDRLAAEVSRVFSDHSPLVHTLGDQLRSRLVFGYEELREKLVIWQAGLDDALVECVKVRAIASDPTLALTGSHLVVDRADTDDQITLLWLAADGATRLITLPPHWLADTDRDRTSLMLRFPEFFAGGYVNFHRFLDTTASLPLSSRSALDHT